MRTFGSDGHLPPQAVMLHIGPHKTGTTAIQGSLAAARPALRKRDVFYPGGARQQRMPALAVTGRSGPAGLPTPRDAQWRRLVKSVRRKQGKQVVLSGEAFTEADDKRARLIVEQLGGDKVHIVVTLRPLAKILPSAWQQYVRNRMRLTYDEWLDATLNNRPEVEGSSFWHRHRHDELIERWLSIVGPRRLAVVVANDADREFLMRGFESLLDLPTGFLAPEATSDNRGLTAQEIELIRQLNLAFEEHDWPSELYHDVVRRGTIRRMQQRQPAPEEPKIYTAPWAVDRANEIARAASERIRGFGITVIGDLDLLSAVTAGPPPPNGTAVAQELVVSAMREAIAGTRDAVSIVQARGPAEGGGRPIDQLATSELLRIVGARTVRKARGKPGRGTAPA